MNRVLSADFLRVRREVLQPEDVGLPCGRTTLLRDPAAVIDLRTSQLGHLLEFKSYCQRLVDPEQGQKLLIFSTVPGSPSHEKLRSLAPAGA
ncbi:hypothetical protein [Streptomyces mirabilis]|uniref:hypothetical protein n=1 Tax=Streptomyces mirabilis TaxID=68239 RepID=UPI00225AAE8A|nr:hypothetical protein [Streptomyces mirabilis]MCX4428542.1 hypothetical protein [Streptomyces mirabilis]